MQFSRSISPTSARRSSARTFRPDRSTSPTFVWSFKSVKVSATVMVTEHFLFLPKALWALAYCVIVRQLFSTLYSGVSFLLALQVMEKVFPRWMVKSTTLMDEKASRFFWLASTDVDIPLSLSSLSSLSSPSSSQSEMASINSLKDGSPSATERPKRTRW